MHPNEAVLRRLFSSLNAHDHVAMAECYSENATFRDIAFTLTGREQIHAMWDLACSPNGKGVPSDITADVLELRADASAGHSKVVDRYTFRDTGRPVKNTITSQFTFSNGKVTSQVDDCNPRAWARQAFGGIRGLLAGNIAVIRRKKAMKKLRQERPNAFRT